MPLNASKQQRDKSAKRDHKRKLILESSFLPTINKKFNQIASDFQKTVAKTGAQPSILSHTNDFQNILADHYDTTNQVFSSDIVKQLGEPDNYTDVQQTIETRNKVNTSINSANSSQIIGQTTHNNMRDSLKKVIIDAALSGLFLTNVQISIRATAELRKKFAARAPMIALTETQRPAEHAKQTELNALISNNSTAGDVKFGLGGAQSDKQWVAILDNVTRDSHAQADGQVKAYNEPYIVMGEKLMYPGDTSMGASMANIANCRCSSVPVVK